MTITKYWNGSEWIECSAAAAAVHRERGRRVIERPAAGTTAAPRPTAATNHPTSTPSPGKK